jgi:hypothetical protein
LAAGYQQTLAGVVIGREDVKPVVAIRVGDAYVKQLLRRGEWQLPRHERIPRWPERAGIAGAKFTDAEIASGHHDDKQGNEGKTLPRHREGSLRRMAAGAIGNDLQSGGAHVM